MMILSGHAGLMLISVAAGAMVVRRKLVAMMPERHANPRAHGGNALDGNSKGNGEDDQQAG